MNLLADALRDAGIITDEQKKQLEIEKAVELKAEAHKKAELKKSDIAKLPEEIEPRKCAEWFRYAHLTCLQGTPIREAMILSVMMVENRPMTDRCIVQSVTNYRIRHTQLSKTEVEYIKWCLFSTE